MKLKKTLWSWFVQLVILMVIVVAFGLWQSRDAIEGKAPLLHGQLLSGAALLPSQLEGKPYMVHFWATWCPICGLEDQSVNAVAKKYRVITIATTSGDAKEIDQYMKAEGLNFPVLLDESGDIGRSWGVKGVPSSFFINAQGDIESVQIGYTSELGMLFRLWLL